MHTPGPWGINDDSLKTKAIIYDKHHGSDIAAVFKGPEGIANARLIAAAPDLLETIQVMEKYLVNDPRITYSQVLRMVRAAIAKAKGV